MQVVTFKEILKGFIQALQLPFVIPAILINTIWFFYFIPTFFPEMQNSKGIDFYEGVYVYFTLITSYLFYSNNAWLIRFFEGYHFTEYDFVRKYYSFKIKGFKNEFEYLEKLLSIRLPEDPVIRKKLETFFPADKNSIMPTRFGNIMTAMEHYPLTRYGIESVQIWARLIPVLQERKFMDTYIAQKSIFDMTMNLLVTIPISSLFLWYIALQNMSLWILILPVMGLVLCKIMYEIMLSAATNWGVAFKVSFDLYRKDLAKMANIRRPVSFEDEKGLWQDYSLLIHKGLESENIFSYTEVKK